MNEIIKGEIKELAEIILEQTNKLLAYKQGAPRIEVDIIKENIRKLYDKMDVLIDVNWHVTPPTEQSLEERLDEQVDELLNIAEAEFQGSLKEMGDLIDEQYDTKEEDSEILPKIVDKAEIIDFPQEEKEDEALPAKQNKESIKEEPNVHDENASIGDQLQRKPLKSLKTSISINDKFQFINELFDGSMKIYNQAIEQLEQSDGLKSAMQTFNSIADTGLWDKDNPVYNQLLDYVERRFL